MALTLWVITRIKLGEDACDMVVGGAGREFCPGTGLNPKCDFPTIFCQPPIFWGSCLSYL